MRGFCRFSSGHVGKDVTPTLSAMSEYAKDSNFLARKQRLIRRRISSTVVSIYDRKSYQRPTTGVSPGDPQSNSLSTPGPSQVKLPL